MNISEALFRGRTVYGRLFAPEQNTEEEYAPQSLSPPQALQAPEGWEKARINTERAQFAGESGSYSLGSLGARFDDMAAGSFSAVAAPQPSVIDETLELLINRMENDSRMYPQDFREE